MADDKKPAPPPENDPFVEIVWLFLSIMVALYFLNGLINFFRSGSLPGFPNLFAQIKSFFLHIAHFWMYFAMLLSGVFLVCIVWLFKKLKALRAEEAKKMYIEVAPVVTVGNPQWERVVSHSESLNENDWRLAILEADIMLGDLLEKLSLPGETMGDKLKAAKKENFTTIDNAWEAHKIRNQIAHSGLTFLLNQHEVRRVIALYKNVFEEFKLL
jgi:hypothetical protein